MDVWQPVKSALDWKRIRDAHVPEVSEHDPAVAHIRAELTWLEEHPAPPGNDPLFGKSYTEIQKELRQYLLDEIERYRWRKAGFNVTQDILDMLREEECVESKSISTDTHRYTNFGEPFQWGGRTVCLAQEILSSGVNMPTVGTRRVVIDMATGKEIEGALDLGSHVIHSEPGGPSRVHPVVDDNPRQGQGGQG